MDIEPYLFPSTHDKISSGYLFTQTKSARGKKKWTEGLKNDIVLFISDKDLYFPPKACQMLKAFLNRSAMQFVNSAILPG